MWPLQPSQRPKTLCLLTLVRMSSLFFLSPVRTSLLHLLTPARTLTLPPEPIEDIITPPSYPVRDVIAPSYDCGEDVVALPVGAPILLTFAEDTIITLPHSTFAEDVDIGPPCHASSCLAPPLQGMSSLISSNASLKSYCHLGMFCQGVQDPLLTMQLCFGSHTLRGGFCYKFLLSHGCSLLL